MKQLFRSIVFVLLVSGWALASAALYVVRTPSKILVFPKNSLGYRDTYVDTRSWTINDDRAHSAVVTRIIQLGKSDALAHTVNTKLGPVGVQLAVAVATPLPAGPGLDDKAKAELKAVGDDIKARVN